MITINSNEVGGGQVPRHILSLLTLLCSLGQKALTLTNIRATRPTPGLHAQALAGISAVSKIFGGAINFADAELGSTSLGITIPDDGIFESFEAPATIEVSTGTAGSTALVLQALLGIIPFGTVATIVGGTNVDFSPPTDHVDFVLIPMLALWGITLVHTTIKRGVYPRGGGQTQFSVDRRGLKNCEFIVKGDITRVLIRFISGSRELEIDAFLEALKETIPDLAKYSSLIESEYIIDGLMGNKKRGKTQVFCVIETSTFCRLSSSVILNDLVDTIPIDHDNKKICHFLEEIQQNLSSSATFDVHTADQMLLPMALAAHAAKMNPNVGHNGVSAIRVPKVDGVDHITSAFDTFDKLLPTVLFSVEACVDGSQIISCSPNPDFDPEHPYGSAISE
jgi:RNA 3'-terminal phosphate cyclase